jgi:hypothetical protein
MRSQMRSTVDRTRGTLWDAREQQMRAMGEGSKAPTKGEGEARAEAMRQAWISLHAKERGERSACIAHEQRSRVSPTGTS